MIAVLFVQIQSYKAYFAIDGLIIIIETMPKVQRKVRVNCDCHEFCLRPRSQYTINAHHYNVSFCEEASDLHTKEKKKRPYCLNCPTFNEDNNCMTPSFILKTQKQFYEDNKEKLRLQHQQNYAHYTEEKDELNMPKPKSKIIFCSVCRNNYQDYLQHISSEIHKRKISQSVFNRYILQLSQKYASMKRKIVETQQEKPINVNEQSESQIHLSTKKQIKPNETISLHHQIKDNQLEELQCQNPVNFMEDLAQFYREHIKQQQMRFNYNMSIYLNHFPIMHPLFPQLQFPVIGLTHIQQVSLPFISFNYSNSPLKISNEKTKEISYIVID